MEEYNNMKVGDLITAYAPGYHTLVKIEQEGEHILFYYKQEYDTNGFTRQRSQVKICNAAYCIPAILDIETQISNKIEELAELKELLRYENKKRSKVGYTG